MSNEALGGNLHYIGKPIYSVIINKWPIKCHHPSVTTLLVCAGCCVEGHDANTKVRQVGRGTKPVTALAQGVPPPCRDTLDANSTALQKKWSGAKQKELDREDGSLFSVFRLTGASTGVEKTSSISG